jgi:hypothetical protein
MIELPCEELVAADGKRDYQDQKENDVFQLGEKALSGGEEVVHVALHSKLNEGELKTWYRFGSGCQMVTF